MVPARRGVHVAQALSAARRRRRRGGGHGRPRRLLRGSRSWERGRGPAGVAGRGGVAARDGLDLAAGPAVLPAGTPHGRRRVGCVRRAGPAGRAAARRAAAPAGRRRPGRAGLGRGAGRRRGQRGRGAAARERRTPSWRIRRGIPGTHRTNGQQAHSEMAATTQGEHDRGDAAAVRLPPEHGPHRDALDGGDRRDADVGHGRADGDPEDAPGRPRGGAAARSAPRRATPG